MSNKNWTWYFLFFSDFGGGHRGEGGGPGKTGEVNVIRVHSLKLPNNQQKIQYKQYSHTEVIFSKVWT